MGIQQIGRLVYRTALITSTDLAWPVPTNIVRGHGDTDAVMWMDGSAGGGGGGGGNSTPGGGGGGGSPGQAVTNVPFPVTVGGSLSIVVGTGGVGGAANNDGVSGTTTKVNSGLWDIALHAGPKGKAGANPNGGNGGGDHQGANVASGGAGVGVSGTTLGDGQTMVPINSSAFCQKQRICLGAAGGALNNNGGYTTTCGRGTSTSIATGGANGGGGGAGGNGPYGTGGNGGSNGAAGSNATGFGAAGGGGSGNSAGGNGAPGFVRLYWWEWTV